MIVSNDEPQERAPDPTSAAERLSLAAHQKRQAKLGFVPGIDYKGPVDTADNVRAAREQLISERKRELRRQRTQQARVGPWGGAADRARD